MKESVSPFNACDEEHQVSVDLCAVDESVDVAGVDGLRRLKAGSADPITCCKMKKKKNEIVERDYTNEKNQKKNLIELTKKDAHRFIKHDLYMLNEHAIYMFMLHLYLIKEHGFHNTYVQIT